jgi:hypothetical protein
MSLVLLHKLKSKTKHEIPLDEEKALANSAFAIYRTEKAGVKTNTGIGWRVLSTQKGIDGKKAKYECHEFEIVVSPEQVDKLIAALEWAKKEWGA